MFFTFVPKKPDGFIKVFHILMWLGLHRVGVALFYIGLQNRGGIWALSQKGVGTHHIRY